MLVAGLILVGVVASGAGLFEAAGKRLAAMHVGEVTRYVGGSGTDRDRLGSHEPRHCRVLPHSCARPHGTHARRVARRPSSTAACFLRMPGRFSCPVRTSPTSSLPATCTWRAPCSRRAWHQLGWSRSWSLRSWSGWLTGRTCDTPHRPALASPAFDPPASELHDAPRSPATVLLHETWFGGRRRDRSDRDSRCAAQRRPPSARESAWLLRRSPSRDAGSTWRR